MHPTGNRYAILIPVHIVWLNQNDEFVKQTDEELGRDGIYTDKPPEDYEVISVKAYMTDIWKIGSEITVDEKAPTVRYDKFAEEYRIVYRLNLTPEEEAEIMGLTPDTGGESTEETGTGDTAPSETPDSTATAAEQTEEPDTQTAPQETETYTEDPAETVTAALPTQTDESFRTGSGRTTLIIGLVIGIAVIYLIVISIGTNSRKKNSKRKNRL